MDHTIAERTPQVIADEINAINQKSRRMLLINAIEVGRRLKEVKELLQHGEWGKWLAESVNYTQRTAVRLMKLFEEYGPKLSDNTDLSNWTALSNLTYTHALLLLGLPEAEREEFMAQNDVGNMTSRKLQKAVKNRRRNNAKHKKAPQKNTQAQAPAGEAVTATDQISAAADISPASSTLSGPTAPFTHNLPTERDPNAAARHVERCDTCCKTIADTFFELTTALTNLTFIDAKLKEKKRKDAQKLLDSIAEQIKVWPRVPKPPKGIR